jgi:hypothetical protein
MKLSSLLKTAICCIALVSCNNVTGSNSQQPSQDKASASDDKHTTEYITQRLNDIFTEAFNEESHNLLALDHKFMSQEYNRLQDKAMEIADRIEDLVIDADHWVQGQEWTYPTMAVGKIENITATTATAHVTITTHMPGNDEHQTQLILPLVFERNDWYIDNMQQYYEGELLDEKAWYQEYVTTHKND